VGSEMCIRDRLNTVRVLVVKKYLLT